MGTLVKEDFGRPDRSNTMVKTEFWIVYVNVLCCLNDHFPFN